MTKLLYAASAAAILTVAGLTPAMAQSSMSAPMITCKDISTMDRETARGVVFYLSGFKAASGSQSSASSGTGGSTGTDSTTSGTSGSTAADAGSSASGSSGSSSNDTTGSTTAADGSSSGASGTSASGSASGASGGASSMVVSQLPGFSGVDIDKIMTDCASTPDKQLSDMLGTSSSQ
jgi:hypothetical protein